MNFCPYTIVRRLALGLGLAAAVLTVAACSNLRPFGLIYTDTRYPLTKNLHNTPMPANTPSNGRTLEIKEPITGLGLYARVDSNAIGDIARQNGMQTLYFADQETFSILGIWTTVKTILYGE
jgi:hypothetical protein